MAFKDITFIPKSEEAANLVERPIPASQGTPDWWKKLPAFENGKNPSFSKKDGSADVGMKMCVPMADTFRMGYIQRTWTDIYIEPAGDDDFGMYYSSMPEIMELRDQTALPDNWYTDFYDRECAWKTQWSPKLPEGYSAFITHPLNRYDLPFLTMSGVVDSDKFFHEGEGNHPVFIKKSFSGMIPVGTPMFQIIPFKRDDWRAKEEAWQDLMKYKRYFLRKHFYGAYKKYFWSKKTFK